MYFHFKDIDDRRIYCKIQRVITNMINSYRSTLVDYITAARVFKPLTIYIYF